MQFKVITFNPQNAVPEHSLFVLSKGLHSGKIVETPTVNCFVVSFKSLDHLAQAKVVINALYHGKRVQELLVGSVITYIRIDEYKVMLRSEFSKVDLSNEKTKKAIASVEKMAELQKSYRQNLLLIRDVQRLLYLHILRSK